MTYKKLILVTGGIASGKSIACDYFKRMDFPVFSADSYTKDIYKDAKVRDEMILAFGECVYIDSGQIDRDFLRNLIAESEMDRLRLNKITHQAIIKSIDIDIRKLNSDFVFVEIPLYADAKDLVDQILAPDFKLLIEADTEVRLKRLIARSKVDFKTARKLITAQENSYKKGVSFDYIIYNNTDLRHLYLELDKLINLLKRGEL